MRDLLCASLRESDVGTQVSVCGLGRQAPRTRRTLSLLDVRDHSGIIQAVVEARSTFVVSTSYE